MAFTVEDGTGLSNSNSYISEAGANTYHEDRGKLVEWNEVTNKEALLVLATDFLRDGSLLPWRGSRKTATQALDWPRSGVQERHGQPVPDDEVPMRVANATAELALILSTKELHPIITRTSGDIRKKKVDVLETEYFSSKFRTNNPADYTAIVTAIMGLLSPLLRSGSQDFLDAEPFADLPDRETVTDLDRPLFYDGIHDNN